MYQKYEPKIIESFNYYLKLNFLLHINYLFFGVFILPLTNLKTTELMLS